MSDGEILYDDVAMENVHSLLVAANNKLMLAKEYYNSDKLSGRALINDVESFMDEIAPYLSSYSHASDGIYEGKSLEFDFSENIDVASFYSSREEIMGGMYVESSTSNILDTSLGDSDSPYQVPEKKSPPTREEIMGEVYVMSSNTTTIDQNILDMIFGPIYPTYQLPQEKKSIAHDLMIEYMNDFVLYLMDKFNCSDEVAVNMFFYILMRFDDEDEYYYSSSFNLIIDFLSTLEEEEPDRVNEFMNSLIQYSDTKVLTDSILSYMEKSGMSPKETVKAFSNYNDATGGICSYAVFSKNICDQLTDEEFREHFGFEKYVEFNGEKIYNPLLLADMVFETNRMDRSDEWYSPNFVEENGKWYRKDDGELKDNALSYTSGFFEIDVANYYLGLKGLRVTKLSEEEINGMVISYNPDVSSDISRSDYLKLVVEAALNEGYSIRLGMCYGVQFTNIDTGYREYIGFDSGHDVNVIGTCEEGFVIATWGEYYVLPYNYADAVHEGYQQVNYSIIKIEEIGE